MPSDSHIAGADLHADVLVIGGGIAGCSTAFYLAREGVDVLLIDRTELNTQASGVNAGSLHAQIPNEEFVAFGESWARSFGPTLRLLRKGVTVWEGLGDEVGCDLEVDVNGGLIVADDDAQMEALTRKAAIERANGLDVRLLTRAELRDLAPYFGSHVIGGALCAVEGKANPLLATPALAQAASRSGARIERHMEVSALESDGTGFLARTNRGDIRCHRIVDAAGADCARVAAMLGVDLPITSHPIHMNVTEPVAPVIKHLVYYAGGRLTLKQGRGGTVIIGGGWPSRLDPATGHCHVLREAVEANLWTALQIVPALAPVNLVRTWAGLVNGTADWNPILGEVPSVPGFYVFSFPFMGFTGGPIGGRLLSELMTNRAPSVDVAPFAPR